MDGRVRKWWSSDLGSFLTMGLQLALTVVIFFFLGRWLDGQLGTSPWLMVTGLVVGIVGGCVKFFRTAIALGKQADHEAEERREGTTEGR